MSDRINYSVPIVERTDIAANLPADLTAVRARVFMMNACRIIVSYEPAGWHLSISKRDRDPSWDEIVTARYRLLPDVPNMVMHLPAVGDYVNVHPHTFHLMQAPL